MGVSATSFCRLMQKISEAISVKESAIDYDDLLREIFEDGAPYDKLALADSENMQGKLESKNFPSEKVFGRDRAKKMLLSKLIDPDEKLIQLSVIPILGVGGIGKTTLAQLVYDDEVVTEHFELRVWVKVDGQELKLQHAAQEILKSTMGMSCSLDGLGELDEIVKDTLQCQRCLIVFDGIESIAKDSWLHMNKYWFDFVDLGSSILITTTSANVADLVANQTFVLRELSQEDGWSMCRYLAFDSSEGVKDISRVMAKNLTPLCQSIPLSLKLVGSMMRYEDKLRNLVSSVDFSDHISLPPSDASFAILLRVWALPPHLRQCLAYCALFPKGYALKKVKIIDMWIADGLVKPSPGNNSLHGIGDSYFHQLRCRSFFTDITCDQYSDIIEFRIPGLIHEIGGDVARIVYKEKLGLIGSISEDAGQLSLVLPFSGKYKSEHIGTLIFLPPIYLGGGSLECSLLDFQELKSLDLSCSGIRSLSDDICVLRELRYLNLSYTLIERLPDSITDLSRLQTLDLSGCYRLKVLPKGIRNLTHMSHLDLSLCVSLSCLPSGIGFVISLTSMPLFVLGEDHDCAHLGELGRLNQLRGRLEIRNLENVRETSEAHHAKLYEKNLHHLGLSWSQNSEDSSQVLELLEPNPHLKVLDLTGYMGYGFPRWISSINSLIKVSITDCGCDRLPSLGQLPFLKELQLKGMWNIQLIGEEFYGHGVTDIFPSLEKLELYDMPKLIVWLNAGPAAGSGSSVSCMFSGLKNLTIEGCHLLACLPTLLNLSELIVQNSSITIFWFLASFSSLSFLLIKDMDHLVISYLKYSKLNSLKKLILFNIEGFESPYLEMEKFPALEHLSILHCRQLKNINLYDLVSLQKLHIVDCQNLRSIHFIQDVTSMIELVIEDCPDICIPIDFHDLRLLRKLIFRGSGVYVIRDVEDLKELRRLEYLSICDFPVLERELEMRPSLMSHIPCVILGNSKAAKMNNNWQRSALPSTSELKGAIPWSSTKVKTNLQSPLLSSQQDSNDPMSQERNA